VVEEWEVVCWTGNRGYFIICMTAYSVANAYYCFIKKKKKITDSASVLYTQNARHRTGETRGLSEQSQIPSYQ
jgi:cbb3-type cytochrome oxidase subunit 3